MYEYLLSVGTVTMLSILCPSEGTVICWGRQRLLTHALQSDHSIGLMRETASPYSSTFSRWYKPCIAVWPQQWPVKETAWDSTSLMLQVCWACCTVMHSSTTTVLVCWVGQLLPVLLSSGRPVRWSALGLAGAGLSNARPLVLALMSTPKRVINKVTWLEWDLRFTVQETTSPTCACAVAWKRFPRSAAWIRPFWTPWLSVLMAGTPFFQVWKDVVWMAH